MFKDNLLIIKLLKNIRKFRETWISFALILSGFLLAVLYVFPKFNDIRTAKKLLRDSQMEIKLLKEKVEKLKSFSEEKFQEEVSILDRSLFQSGEEGYFSFINMARSIMTESGIVVNNFVVKSNEVDRNQGIGTVEIIVNYWARTSDLENIFKRLDVLLPVIQAEIEKFDFSESEGEYVNGVLKLTGFYSIVKPQKIDVNAPLVFLSTTEKQLIEKLSKLSFYFMNSSGEINFGSFGKSNPFD